MATSNKKADREANRWIGGLERWSRLEKMRGSGILRFWGIGLCLFAPPAPAPTLPGVVACGPALGLVAGAAPSIGVHEGTLVDLKKIGNVPVPKGAKVYLLGDGEEAFVYRIVPARGESYVLRLQKPDAFLPNVVYRRKMLFLEEVLSDDEGDPLPGDRSFKVPTCATTEDPNVLRLSDVRGETLEAIVDRLGPESEEAKRLIAAFDARGEDLVRRAPTVVPSASSEPVRNDTRGGIRYQHPHVVTHIQIPGIPTGGLPPVVGTSPIWRNIIVDPITREMTIVDPD